MKLYYSPGACSLASHIALEESAADYEAVKVDLKTHKTEHGQDFFQISPRGYVPALDTEDAGLLSENAAVLSWLADHGRNPPQPVQRYKILEWIGFTGTEIHTVFHPLFHEAADKERAAARQKLTSRFTLAGELMGKAEWLVGKAPTVADNYLFVMTLWAEKMKIDVPLRLAQFRDRNLQREPVKRAMTAEKNLQHDS